MKTSQTCLRTGVTAIALFAVLSFNSNAQITYVRQGASGDGSSWEQATGCLQAALAAALPGSEVWVARGTYQPAGGREQSFLVPSGVRVFGGFAGTETSPGQRNADSRTVLSGDIGLPGNPADNCFHVVSFRGAASGTLLDGFCIQSGNANGEGDAAVGGGVHNDGRAQASSPLLRNCVFTKNLGSNGAAFYNDARGGKCSPRFEGCVFMENEAGLDGGAVFNDGREGGVCSAVFTGCHFARNVATYGGGVFNTSQSGGACLLSFEGCSFFENAALVRGGVIFSVSESVNCQLEMSDCIYSYNYPNDRDTMFASTEARREAYRVKE